MRGDTKCERLGYTLRSYRPLTKNTIGKGTNIGSWFRIWAIKTAIKYAGTRDISFKAFVFPTYICKNWIFRSPCNEHMNLDVCPCRAMFVLSKDVSLEFLRPFGGLSGRWNLAEVTSSVVDAKRFTIDQWATSLTWFTEIQRHGAFCWLTRLSPDVLLRFLSANCARR